MASAPVGATFVAIAPATTSNLGPGFDALGAALALTNRFVATVVATPAEAKVEARGQGAALLHGASETAVHSGARAAAAELGLPLPPFALLLDNAVPLGSGLGSSSTALCAGVALGWALCGRDPAALDRDWLLRLACRLEGHPDNAAPCVLGGVVVAARGADGSLHALQLPTPAALHCCAVTPRLSLSTAEMRAALPKQVPFAAAVDNGVHATLLGAALALGRLDLLAVATRDRLHEHVRGAHIPAFAAVRAAGLDAGAKAVPISGAGPTMIALCDGANIAVAAGEAMVRAFAAVGVEADARPLPIRGSGLELRTENE
ncbi:MAG: homoserine kinase [Deltaproteobacteria bacterium]|nr:homoserine kinase [Deltaproteobacteria bacterium]